jgi:hypothetical protein
MDVDPLHHSLQSITELLDPAYWRLVCPFLTCGSTQSAVLSPACTPLETVRRTQNLITRGFFRINAVDSPVPLSLAASLETGVLRLVALGHSPTSIICYDEVWEYVRLLDVQLSAAQPGNVSSGDSVAFLVTPTVHVFTGPHRDKPCAGPSSFHADGVPCYTTVWVALSDATPDSSCLYFLPADRDAGYLTAGDNLLEALPSPAHWPSIVAQPCVRGDVLIFSHRVLHWGSTSQADAPHRVALSFAFSDTAFEEAAFPAAFLPLPPLGLRLGLLSGQAILYAAQAPLTKGALALNNRVFASQQGFFNVAYAEKVLASAQSLKFVASQSRRGK